MTDARGAGPVLPPDHLRQAVERLLAGQLVALPTETVYGLGADAANPEAVARIYAAKGRPADHPLIVHLAAAAHLAQWAAHVPPAARALAAAFWPGPLTLILKKQDWVPLAVTGGQDTVGLRVPGHPLALALLAAFAAARAPAPAGVAAPSANRFGRVSPTTAAHVREEMGEKVALILDGGPCEVGIESTIVDFSRATPEILRPGAITAEDIVRVAGISPRARGGPAGGETLTAEAAPRVPGSLAAHYAPRTPLRLADTADLAATLARLARAGQRVAVLAYSALPHDAGRPFGWLAAAPEPAGYARQLYASLRALDALGADLLLVENPPALPAWRAIADRLRRAAAGAVPDGPATSGAEEEDHPAHPRSRKEFPA
ncbi:MAG: threonylcarbamoyl-AMP synthase [Azoarcus sp.]|jgi:L-threonylcarbamoyladenylate synthase|nr:threonylcarbamoyl-AMP synthase [Azoarcus sp.]